MLVDAVQEVTDPTTPWYWWAIGFGGQLCFGARFYVQWLASERARASVIPKVFWYLSLAGGLLVLTYAIYRVDPVFILAQIGGPLIYTRNLMLLRNEHSATGDKMLCRPGLLARWARRAPRAVFWMRARKVIDWVETWGAAA